MARVLLEGVAKEFGGALAVDRLDLDVRDRELLALLGPSGCGKSTVLNIVAGLESPSAGEVTIGERRVTQLEPNERDVAMVFQSYALYPHKTVFDNVAFPLKLRRVPRDEIGPKVRDVAVRLGIQDLLGRRPSELSGGQRQRVALGRALVRRPSVFLLDEPLSNLDAQLRTEMRAEIKRLHAEFATTTLYVTHDQTEAMTLADRVAVLKAGKLQQLGSPDEIYRLPANRFVAGFVGNPGMSFVPGRIEAGRVRLPGLELELALPSDAAQRDVLVGIRPEDVEVGGSDGTRGEVYAVEPLGAEALVVFLWGGARVTARAPASFRAAAGEPLGFRLARERLLLFDPESGARLAQRVADAPR
jgi:multiple sugar transport system ATP-binding protein